MRIISSAFQHDFLIPPKYTCDEEDINPPLQFIDVPANAVSLVLILEDPDVPTKLEIDGIWNHWIIFNIPPITTAIAEKEEPPGVHGTGTAGNTNYHGPCPPDREHRYLFKLFAIDTTLSLSAGVDRKTVEQAMQGHILAQAELIGRYERHQ